MGSGQSTKNKKAQQNSDAVIERRPSMCFDDFQILRAIGKGSFGKVCIVQKKDSMKMYAMKYMNKNQCVEKDAFKNVVREIEILSTLDHPFLVNLWFTFQDEEDMFMVVDLLLGGDLRYHLQQCSSEFDQERVMLYVCEIGLALDYLRSKNILHRDIKPDNILLDDSGHAHITDFNIATIVKDGEMVTSVSGTKPYMAPEVMICAIDHSEGYSFPADWWSLGVTAYEMLCRRRPYDIHSATTSDEIRDMIASMSLRFPPNVSSKTCSFILKLLCMDPNRRISSVAQMKRHPLLSKTDFDAIYRCEVAPSFIPNKNQLNCDPTYELEEMIIEAKPLHKKKKRLSKRQSRRSSNMNSEEAEALKKCLDTIEQNFIIYNREKEMERQQLEEMAKDNKELQKDDTETNGLST